MLLRKFNYLILFLLFISYNVAKAQTTINYTSSGINTTLCNVFNVATPLVINSVTHFPVSGGVSFNGTALVLKTQYSTNVGSNLGTAYAVKYAFKNATSYTVKVTAYYTSSANSAPYVEIGLFNKLPDPNKTKPTGCGPVDQNAWGGLTSNTVAATYVSKSSQQYVLTNFTTSGNFDYMTILASKGSSTDPSNVLITEVVITENAPSTPTFSLSPSSISKTCGTAINQTFTANGVNIPGGASVSYLWDLGSSSNRWYYGGSPASQTISTSGNTITLTDATCDLAPTNISVTVTVNGTNYPAGSVTVSMSPFTISGPSYVCSSSTSTAYSIANLGCSPTVSWSASPSGIVTINSPNSDQTTISYVSSGNVTLTATYSSPCGSGTLSIPVTSGSPVPIGTSNYLSNYHSSHSGYLTNQYEILGANHGQPGDNDVAYNYNIYDPLFSSITWTPVSQPSGTNYQVVDGGTTMYAYVTYSGTNGSNAITMNLQASGPCGTYSQNITSTAARISGWGGYSALVYPNPAKGSTNISLVSDNKSNSTILNGNLKSNSTTKPLIYGIQITNQLGTVVKSLEYKSGVSKINISLANIPPGIYKLALFDGILWNSQQLIVQ